MLPSHGMDMELLRGYIKAFLKGLMIRIWCVMEYKVY